MGLHWPLLMADCLVSWSELILIKVLNWITKNQYEFNDKMCVYIMIWFSQSRHLYLEIWAMYHSRQGFMSSQSWSKDHFLTSQWRSSFLIIRVLAAHILNNRLHLVKSIRAIFPSTKKFPMGVARTWFGPLKRHTWGFRGRNSWLWMLKRSLMLLKLVKFDLLLPVWVIQCTESTTLSLFIVWVTYWTLCFWYRYIKHLIFLSKKRYILMFKGVVIFKVFT